MLELVRVSAVDWNNRSINVQFSHKGDVWSKLGSESMMSAFSEPEKPHKYILFRIFIRDESFPAIVGNIVSPDKFDIFRFDFKVNLLDANFSCPNISARNIHFSHLCQSQLS